MPSDALALMARLQQRDAAGIARCLRAHPDALASLAGAALSGGMAVPLLHALGRNAMTDRLAPEARAALERRRERQRVRHALLADGLGAIAARFDAAGVPFILLKGPCLALRLYGDAQAREFVDVDLMVRHADRERACALLAAAGYARRSRIIGSATLTARFVHGFDYVREGVNVDLHWGLARDPSFAIDEDGLWRRRIACRLDASEYAIPGDEDTLTLEVLGLLRDIERGRPKPKNVVELVALAAMLDGATDWDALLARSGVEGTRGALVNVLALALDEAAAHDLAPRLSATLARHAARRVPVPRNASLLAPRRGAVQLASRLWAARAHDTPLARWFGWWLVSLPFRRAVHGWPRPQPAGAAPKP